MHCLGQVLGNPELEESANQHEDYLARYVVMDGRGIAMSTAFPSFAKDGFVAVHCKDIEVMKMDYRNVGVYATCDSWFCLGMDEFQNTTGACSRGCGSGRTASWAVRFSAVLRDSEGEKIEAMFEGHYCTEVLFENKRKEGWHINAPGVPYEDDVFTRYRKTRRYTNVVCCEVKILHSGQNPGPSAAPNSFRGERNTAFFLSFFLLFPTLYCVAP